MKILALKKLAVKKLAVKQLTLLSMLLCSSLVGYANNSEAKSWDFDVSMDGKVIGTHSFMLEAQDGKQLLKSDAKFNVKFLSVTVFRYHHTANEVWENDCLQKLDAKTEENSKVTQVNGLQEKQNFKVTAQKPLQIASECVMTFAYWNPKILQQKKLLNPQTGDYLAANISSLGKQTISVRGQPVNADHYKIDTTKFKIDIWYSVEGDWLALQSLTPDGRIDYALK